MPRLRTLAVYKAEKEKGIKPPYKKDNAVFLAPIDGFPINPMNSSDREIKRFLRKKLGKGWYKIIFYDRDGPRHIFKGEIR